MSKRKQSVPSPLPFKFQCSVTRLRHATEDSTSPTTPVVYNDRRKSPYETALSYLGTIPLFVVFSHLITACVKANDAIKFHIESFLSKVTLLDYEARGGTIDMKIMDLARRLYDGQYFKYKTRLQKHYSRTKNNLACSRVLVIEFLFGSETCFPRGVYDILASYLVPSNDGRFAVTGPTHDDDVTVYDLDRWCYFILMKRTLKKSYLEYSIWDTAILFNLFFVDHHCDLTFLNNLVCEYTMDGEFLVEESRDAKAVAAVNKAGRAIKEMKQDNIDGIARSMLEFLHWIQKCYNANETQ
eukprot:511740_1